MCNVRDVVLCMLAMVAFPKSAANCSQGIEVIMDDLVGSMADMSSLPVPFISSESCIVLVVLIVFLK